MAADIAAANRLVADIADHLGTTPEAIRDPDYLDTMRRRRTDLFAGLLATDPDFARIAQAYLELRNPAGRRAIADTALAIAEAFTTHRGGPLDRPAYRAAVQAPRPVAGCDAGSRLERRMQAPEATMREAD